MPAEHLAVQTMQLKATLVAKGDFLSSTAQVDKTRYLLAFLYRQKCHTWWSPPEDCLMQEWCHHTPFWATESRKITITSWTEQLFNSHAREGLSKLHLGFPLHAASCSKDMPGGWRLRSAAGSLSSTEQVYGRKPIIGTGHSSSRAVFRSRHEVHPEQVHSQWRISPFPTARSPLPRDQGWSQHYAPVASFLCSRQGFSFHCLSLSHNYIKTSAELGWNLSRSL